MTGWDRMLRQRLASPGSRLLGATALVVLLAVLVTWLATERAWYGMTLATTADGQVTLLALDNPAVADSGWLPATRVTLLDRGEPLPLLASDIIEEPDVFDSYTEFNAFLARQGELARLMRSGRLELQAVGANGESIALSLPAQARRPVESLPLSFWMQIFSGIGFFLIGSWVMVLRARDAAARCFMLTGAAITLSVFAAAFYSTRELALPPDLFVPVMHLNHLGAIGFGFALVAIFLYFPRRLLAPVWSWVLAALYGVWVVLELTQATASPQAVMYLPAIILSVLSMVLALIQRWRNRDRPQAVAALRWLALVAGISLGLYVGLTALPLVMEDSAMVSQSMAFGGFLFFYAGFALGLKRYRLFDLDRWAYHLLLWVLAGLALVGLDVLFLTLLHWQQTGSLMLSLLVCGFLYLPLRGWLWRWLVTRPRPNPRTLFNEIIGIALAPDAASHVQRWRALLEQLFAPLHMDEIATGVTQPALDEDGQSLVVPATRQAPALRLVLAEKGRRLFAPADAELAAEVFDMLAYADDSRNAWQEGARQERQRIARDLHDDLGSRLLTGMHQTRIDEVHDTLDLAIAEMRNIVRGMAGKSLPLSQLLAELRAECMARCESAGIEMEWPLPAEPAADDPLLDYRLYRHVTSILRELVSNLIRHAGATRAGIDLRVDEQYLRCRLSDNGQGFDGSLRRADGNGMENMRRRAAAMNATLVFAPRPDGTLAELEVPLQAFMQTGTQHD